MREACRRQISGVCLKDVAVLLTLESEDSADLPGRQIGNFLLDGPAAPL
ncbi:ethanolamine ammonia-lyase, partial [Pseudomonas syringae pv. tagetis]